MRLGLPVQRLVLKVVCVDVDKASGVGGLLITANAIQTNVTNFQIKCRGTMSASVHSTDRLYVPSSQASTTVMTSTPCNSICGCFRHAMMQCHITHIVFHALQPERLDAGKAHVLLDFVHGEGVQSAELPLDLSVAQLGKHVEAVCRLSENQVMG